MNMVLHVLLIHDCALSVLNLSANNLNVFERSDSSAKESCEQGFRKFEKCSQSALRNVVELHLGNDKSSDSPKVDMVTCSQPS